MARKTSSAAGATRAKGASKAAAPKAVAPKVTAPKAATPKAAAKKSKASNSVAAETAVKSDTPKAGRSSKSSAATKSADAPKPKTKKASAPKSVAATKSAPATKSADTAARPVGRPKKAAPVIKLNDRQREFLTRIKGEEDKGGYFMEKKIEERTLEALRERKLIKRGAKDKERGAHPWSLTKLGEKTLGPSTDAAQPEA